MSIAFSTDRVLLAAHHRLPPVVAANGACGAASRLMVRMPDATAWFGFEWHLRGSRRGCDFGFAVDQAPTARRRFAGFDSDHRYERALVETWPWRQVLALAAEWADPSTWAARAVHAVFLEFDAREDGPLATDPSLFLRLAPELAAQEIASPGSPAMRLVELCRGAPLADAVQATLFDVWRAVPADGRGTDLSLMLSRPQAPVRIGVELPAGAVGSFLRAIGAERRAIERLLMLVRAVAPPDRGVRLQVDVLGSVQPRLGIELRQGAGPEGAAGWRATLEAMVAERLCTPDEREQLLAFDGVSREPIEGYGWPCRLLRTVSHVKLAVTPEAAPEAKAYLIFTPQFSLFL